MDLILQDIPESVRVDLEKWAQITIEKWQWNIVQNKLIHTSSLLNSFTYQVWQDAEGNSMMISFAFQYYLKMLDMGVGKAHPYQNTKEERGGRKRYKVYSSTAYSEIMKLVELFQIQYAFEGAKIITNEFTHGEIKGATYKI